MNFRNKIIAFVSIFAIVFISIAPVFASDGFDGGQLGAGRFTVIDLYGFLGGRHEAGGGRFSSKDAYDDYVSTLDSTTISNSDTAFSPSLYIEPSSLSTIQNTSGIYDFNYTPSPLHLSFKDHTHNSSYSSHPSKPCTSFSYLVRSVNFTVAESGDYTIDFGRFRFYPSMVNYYGKPYCYLYRDNGDGTVTEVTNRSWMDMESESITDPGTGLSGADFYDSSWSGFLSSGQTYFFSYGGFGVWTTALDYPISFDVVRYPSVLRPNQTIVPASSRTSYLMQVINNYNSTDNSTKYYIGTVDNSNTVVNVYSPDIFNEQTMIFTEPVSGVQYQCINWKYNYRSGIRGYGLALEPGTYMYNGQDILAIALLYLDDALYIIGYTDVDYAAGSTSGDWLANATFVDKYNYIVAQTDPGDGGGSTCNHVYTSETITAPTCLVQGLRRHTCEFCGHTMDVKIPANGHTWVVAETVETVLNDNGDVVSLGYILYACSVCQETYKQYDGTGQPGPPDGSNNPGINPGFFAWWAEQWNLFVDTLHGWFDAVISAIGRGGGETVSPGDDPLIEDEDKTPFDDNEYVGIVKLLRETYGFLSDFFGGFISGGVRDFLGSLNGQDSLVYGIFKIGSFGR